MKTRILFIHSSSDMYGSDIALINLLKYMDYDKYEVHILIPSAGEMYNELCSALPQIIVHKFDFAILRRKDDNIFGILKFIAKTLGSILLICKLILSNRINLIYANTITVLAGVVSGKILGRRIIWHVHEVINEKKTYQIFISILLECFADSIIVPSNATKNSLLLNNYNKVVVVYNGIDAARFNHFLIRSETRKVFGLDDDTFVIGMIGRINNRKGHKVLIEAAERVMCKKVAYLIVGDCYQGEEYIFEDLWKIINNNHSKKEQFIFLGYRKDTEIIYHMLDILVLPSLKPESFGLVLLEAMANKLPVIATNHGGPVEIVDHNITGFLIPPNDPQVLAKKIDDLALNPDLRLNMGNAGYNKFCSLFTFDSYIMKIKQIINKQHKGGM